MKIAISLMALGVSVFVGAFVPENALGYEANMHGLLNQRIYEESALQWRLQNDLDVSLNALLPNPTMTGSERRPPINYSATPAPKRTIRLPGRSSDSRVDNVSLGKSHMKEQA